MIGLAAALRHLFPGIILGPNQGGVECALFSDGENESIVMWNRQEPQPTQSEIDAVILPAKRAQIIEQINTERDRREQTTFPYAGKLIDSDPVSVQRITVAASTAQMALAAGVPFELNWSCADNSLLTLDAMGVLGMMQALGLHGVHLHYYSRALKAEVLASEDPDSIDILTGWPE